MAPAAPDPYKTLGLEYGANPAEIKKAHKKLALKYHPDKNKGDPDAERKFTEIQEAYEVLQDDKAREAFDNLVKAKKAREAKNAEMDKLRKAQVDKLAEREAAAAAKQGDIESAERKYKAEIDRMREQSKAMMQRAADKRAQQSEGQRGAAQRAVDQAEAATRRQAEVRTELSRTLKVKWPKKGSVTAEAIREAFGSFGAIESCVAGKKSGMLVFASAAAAANAAHAVKAGLVERASELDVTVEWVLLPEDGAGGGGGEGEERPAKRQAVEGAGGEGADGGGGAGAGAGGGLAVPVRMAGPDAGEGGGEMPSFGSFNPEPAQPGDVHRDYESITMMRMRQAAERQRLAEQMMAEEGGA